MIIEADIIEYLEKRLVLMENNYGYLSYLIKERFANEKLFQLEIMRMISLHSDVVEYLPERLYPNSTQKCDFWFKTKDGEESWMEIKTRPTNYRKIKHAKAITHGIDGIINDIDRLREKLPSDAVKYILFAFYPVYPESSQFLDIHLEKICNSAKIERCNPIIETECSNGTFQVYLIKLPF